MTALDKLTEAAVGAALEDYEKLFANGEVESILEGFAEDVEVHYASFPPFTGKDKLREMLQRRFAEMRDYQLSKRLEVLCPPHFVSSWTGSWIDIRTNKRMELFGLELLTVRDGKFGRWTASVSAWPAAG
ncbi:nuclear transport factor 2 family protein [Pseudonocardia acaciae]|uniref:nuclear transport factor 2 family protein n=1 Tax=Pseudonocardia acaciae TaxID=551276 RepID=UPI00048A6A2A|nr:nuclear transport factor 2 family protein [Pseudonocardia acaciae]